MTGAPRQSVKVILYDSAGRILVLRRSAACRMNAGRWEFPGGKADEGELPADAAVREVAEETGLQIQPGRTVRSTDWDADGRTILYVFLDATVTSGELRLSEEHDAAEWVDATRLPAIDLCPQFKPIAAEISLEKRTRTNPD